MENRAPRETLERERPVQLGAPGCPPYRWKPIRKHGQISNRHAVTSADTNPPSFVYVHDLEEPETATLTFQVNSPIPAGGTVLLTIETGGYNGAAFYRYVQASNVERRIRLTGTNFLVKAQLVTLNLFANNPDGSPVFTAGPVGGSVELSVSLTDRDDDPLGDLVPTWNTTPVTVGNAEDRFTGAGTMLQGAFTLQALGGSAALWLFIFDAPSHVAAQLAAQQPLVPPPLLTAAGQNADFSGALRPGALFNTGLSWLLSTTPGVPSLPAAGAVGRFDWLGGY